MMNKKDLFLSDIEFISIDINILTASPTQDSKDDQDSGEAGGGFEGGGNDGGDDYDDE